MGRKTSHDEAIAIFQHVHGGRYDYSKTAYLGALQPIEVVCPKHGAFTIIANNHKLGFGCAQCRKEERLKAIFDEFREQHNDFYDYSKSEYIADNKKIIIICPIHGEFTKLPLSHRKGSGCDACQNKIRSTEGMIKSFKEIHGEAYDYSKAVFVSSTQKVEIICPKHGSFMQSIYKHLDYQGCPSCAGTAKKTTEQAIEEFRQKYGDRFDYSLVEYNGNNKKVKIICRKHGDFRQTPKSHLRSVGCPVCKIQVKLVKGEVENFERVHGDKYDYSLSENQRYHSQHEKISIKCPKHGVFKQSIASHKSGSGCPICAKQGRKSIY